MSERGTYDELPPHYTDDVSDVPPTFQIGIRVSPPLVTLTEVQAHLRLLSAFAVLKKHVERSTKNSQQEWEIFLHKAVYRFDRFMSGKWTGPFPSWCEEVVPPLDVVMVWHTYLLNPKRYYEDSIRSETTFARRLAAMQSMPITLIASLIDPVSLEPTLPSYYREAFFELTSGLQFMYSIHTRTEDVVELTCPRCDAPNARVPWIVSGVGTGFGEAGFTYTCERCEREFTRAMMGVRKFCEEVARRRAGEKVYFAGTLIDGKEGEIVAKMRSFHIVQRIVHMFKLSKVYEEDDIIFQATELAKNMQWSTHEIALHVHHALIPQKKFRHGDHFFPRVQEVFDAYSGAGHASLDLVTCILHQSVFLQALEDMGWLDPRRFHSGCAQAPIFRAIARYHAFMDLIVAKNAGFLIPTLDIDLVWHTHQLSNENYREDTLRLLGHIPGHDDLLQPAVFQEMFRATATGWMNRFGTPYSTCGCASLGSKLDEIKQKGSTSKLRLLSHKGKTKSVLGFLASSATSNTSRLSFLSGLSSPSSSRTSRPSEESRLTPSLIGEEEEGWASHPSEHAVIHSPEQVHMHCARLSRVERTPMTEDMNL